MSACRRTESAGTVFATRFPLLVAALATLALPAGATAQGSIGSRAIGVTARGYPAGGIFTANISFPVGDRNTLTTYAGYNVTDRRNFGEHDDEDGGGPGFGVAARRYVSELYSGFHFGVRADLWFMDIDWADNGPQRTGTSETVVLEPTVEAGYSRILGRGRFVFEATVSLGAEINIDTAGEAVGEGAVLLIGFGLAYRP